MARITHFPYDAEKVNLRLTNTKTGQYHDMGPAGVEAQIDDYRGLLIVTVYTQGAPDGQVWTLSLDRWTLDTQAISSGGAGCVVTTACLKALGKPDDCHELQAFRAMRDRYLRTQPDGQSRIDDYYQTASEVIAILDSTADSQGEWASVYRDLVAPVTQSHGRR